MMTDNVHVEDVRKKRLYGILKAVAVIVAVLVVFAISFVLFTALSGTFDPSDGLKADAWSLGGISGVSTSGGANWFPDTLGSWNNGTNIFSAPTPMTAASGFSGTSFNVDGKRSTTWYFMQLYEIRLNSAQIAAANAGYLGTISITLRLDGNVGSDFVSNWGRTQYTMFIVAGSAGGGSLNSFTAISGTSNAGGFDKEQTNLTRSLSLAVPKGTTVVRFGITMSFRFDNKGALGINPTVTFNGVSLTKYECTQNPLPKLTINSGANGSISSNKYNSYQLNLGDSIDAVSATANPGYYFSGWEISGGVIHSADTWDVNNANNSNIIATRAPLLNIGNATRIVGASNATVTVTARFTQIPFSNVFPEYTYRQNADGTGYRQGPTVGTISGYTLQRYGNTSVESGQNYYSTISGGAQVGEAYAERPYAVGEYRIGVAVMYNGAECGHRVETFRILPITLGNVDKNGGVAQISFDSFSGTIATPISFGNYEYSSLSITPARDTVYMKFGGLLYTLKEDTDYYWGYANNRNVGNATATIYALQGNFLGSFSIPFYIDRITIGSENVYYGQTSFNVDGTTYNTVSRVTTADGRADQSSDFEAFRSQINNAATTIQRDGEVVYTGFEQNVHNSITVVYIWKYVTLDVNTGTKGIVIFPLISNGLTSFRDETGTERNVVSTGVGSYIDLASINKKENDYRNNVDACNYATDGDGAAAVQLYVNPYSTPYNVDFNDLWVHFDIARLNFGTATGEAQSAAMDLIYSGGAQQQKGIEYVYFSYAFDSGVVIPGSGTGAATVVFAAVEDGVTAPAYGRAPTAGSYAPWNLGINYTPAYFDIGTADNSGDVSYSNNIEAGTATMTVDLDTQNLVGTVTTTYRILPLDVTDLPESTDQGHSYGHQTNIVFNPNSGGAGQPVYYDPLSPATPTFRMSITNIYNGGNPQTYIFDTDDYDASGIRYSNNNNAGTATISIPMQGNYTGTYVSEFQILPLNLASAGYVGYITDTVTYKAAQIRGADFDFVFANGYEIAVAGQTFTIPYEKLSDLDATGNTVKQYTLGNAYGGNTDVSDSYTLSGGNISGNAYFTLIFTSVSGDNDLSPNYSGSLRVYFNITPKALWINEAAWDMASGTEGNADGITAASTIVETFNRAEHTPTSDAGINITYNSERLGYNSDYTFTGEYRDNVDAGQALLAVQGMGNYSGKCWVPFTIQPYSIVQTSGGQTTSNVTAVQLDYVRDGKIYSDSDYRIEVGRIGDNGEYIYYYRNNTVDNTVRPNITALSIFMGTEIVPLTPGESEDFVAVYGTDGNVGTHTITIEGRNNYTGTDSETVVFRIEPIRQTVALSADIYYGSGVGSDEKPLLLPDDELGRAAYQISAGDMHGTGIRVSATTTAIAPAVRAEFTLYEILSESNFAPVQLANALYTVTYDADSPVVDVSGRATTSAVIRLNSSLCAGYYIVAVSFPGGSNFLTANITPNAADTSLTDYSDYSVLVKYEDAFDGTSFGGSYMYGDGDVSLPLSMASGIDPFGPELISTSTNVIEVLGKDEGALNYSIRVKSAGETTLKFSHNGYLDATDYSKAYFAFSATAEYEVLQRSLYIFFGNEDGSPVTVTYGDTGFIPGMIQHYTFVGLTDTDEPGQVVSGFTLNSYAYEGETPAAGGYLLEIRGATGQAKFNNYEIKYTTYADYAGLTGDEADNYVNLVVEKAQLTVSAYTGELPSAKVNVVTKVYGAENPGPYDQSTAPDGYKLNYSGFVNGDTEAKMIAVPGFEAPTVDYLGATVTTMVGSKAITITGGSSLNYEFVADPDQLLQVQPAEVNIFVYNTAVEFNGAPIAVDYEIKGILDAEGNALDDFGYDAAREVIFFYYSTPGNLSDYTNATPISAGTYGVGIRYQPQNTGNYKETTKVYHVGLSKAEADRTDYADLMKHHVTVHAESTREPVWDVHKITPYNLEFGYVDGTNIQVYNENGIYINQLVPMPIGLSVDTPTGSYSNVEFRNAGIESAPWQNLTQYDANNNPYAVLSGGTWDIRFDYTSTNPNYASATGYVLAAKIIISADMVAFEYRGGSYYSGVYNGSAHELNRADFTLRFPGGVEFSGTDFVNGMVKDGVKYGSFYYGFLPEGEMPDFGTDVAARLQYLLEQNTQAIDAKSYTIWMIYIPNDMEAAESYRNISSAEGQDIPVFEVTPKMLTANDFTFAGRTWTYDATPHTLTYGEDIFIKSGVLVGAEAESGQLPGNVRIMFRKDGVEYASIINQGQYDIILEYTSGANNNYAMTAGSNVMTGLCKVARREAKIVYTGTTELRYEYNGSERGIVANLTGINGVMPQGNLVYVYRDIYGNQITGVPVNVGTYTVEINYQPTGSGDNFTERSSVYNPGVTITITAATPSIMIYPISLSYEEAMAAAANNGADLYSRMFRIMLAGNDTVANSGRVSVSYGTTTATGISWSETFPFEQGPGSYVVRVTFTSLGSNYQNNVQTLTGALTVRLPSPDLDLPHEIHTFTGEPISITAANIVVSLETATGTVIYYPVGTPGVDNFYYGMINVEYRASDSTGSWTGAPVNAGTYDVRLTYTPSGSDTMFSYGATVIEEVLTIDPVEIRVVPVFGQGKVYDGTFVDQSPIAYMYSYVVNGVLYFEYAAVEDVATGYHYDISKGEYTSGNSVYTVYGGLLHEADGKLFAEQWRDYELSPITYEKAICVIDDVTRTLDLSDMEGIVDIEIDGTLYRADLDRMIIYPAVSEGTRYSVSGGVFLSYTAPDGGVYVTKVDTDSANYVYNAATDTASYTFVREDGVRVSATLDFGRGIADDFRGRVYSIIENAAAVETAEATTYIDFAKLTDVSSDGASAVYTDIYGNKYLILIEENLVLTAWSVTVTEISLNGAIIDVTALESGTFNGEYLYDAGDNEFIIDINNKVAKQVLYYTVNREADGGYTFGYNGAEVAFHIDDAAVIAENYYSIESAGTVFYIDLDQMTARSVENRSYFDLSSAENGIAYEDFLYVLYDDNGNAVSKAPLFGHTLDIVNPTIAGVGLTGTVQVNGALNNGYYQIDSSITSPGSNYTILDMIPEVYYHIAKKAVTIEYTAPEDLVYDGNNKLVGYDIDGVVEGESVNIGLTYQGDNVNVTEDGFKVNAVLTGGNGNYYLVGGESDTYYIELADMNEPVWAVTTTVVYDGLMHTVEISYDDGATLTYLTDSRFVEPGTYSIAVEITKPNFHTLYSSVMLTIKKATFNVVPDAFNGKLVYGDSLPELTANTAGIDGTQMGNVVLDPGQQLIPGTHDYTWSFLPYDPVAFYSRYDGVNGGDIRGVIQLFVEKAQAEIEIFTQLEQTETNPLAIIGAINGNSLNEVEGVTIEYMDGAGNRFASMPTAAGNYTVIVTYEGDELYAETVKEFVITIKEESNFVWMYYVGGAIAGLGIASLIFFLMKRGKKHE